MIIRLQLLSILFFTLFLYSNADGQKIDWIFEPVITEAQKIYIHPIENPLVLVKVGSKYGVKDINDNFVVPAKYKKIKISIDQEYFYIGKSSNTPNVTLLDRSLDSIQSHASIRREHPFETNYYIKNIKYACLHKDHLTKFTEKHNLKLVEYYTKELAPHWRILNKSNKVILDSLNFSNSTKYFEEGYLNIFKDGKSNLYDKKGNIVFKNSGSLTSNKRGVFLHGQKLYNSNFKHIHSVPQPRDKLLETYDLYLTSHIIDDKVHYDVNNLNGQSILGKPYKRVHQHNIHWLILENNEQSFLFDLKEQKIISQTSPNIFFERHYSDNLPTGFILTSSKIGNKKYFGVYDFINQKQILDNNYNFINPYHEQHIYGNQVDKSTSIKTTSIFDTSFNLKFKSSSKSVRTLKHQTFLITEHDKTTKLVDFSGNVIYTPEEGYNIQVTNEYWINLRGKGKKKKFILIHDIIKGEINEYDFFSAPQVSDEQKYDRHFIVSKDKKYGLLSIEDGLVLDMIYDNLVFQNNKGSSKHNNVILALKAGKWGALWNPYLK